MVLVEVMEVRRWCLWGAVSFLLILMLSSTVVSPWKASSTTWLQLRAPYSLSVDVNMTRDEIVVLLKTSREAETSEEPTIGNKLKATLNREEALFPSNKNWTAADALRRFEETCIDTLPALFEAQRRKATLFHSAMNQMLMYEPRTVCISPEVTIFRYQFGGALDTRWFRPHVSWDRYSRVDYRRHRAAFVGNSTQLEGRLAAAMHNRSLVWHHSLGIIMAARFDAHPYHFLLDEALQGVSVVEDEAVKRSRFEPVRISDAVLNEQCNPNDDPPMWPITAALVPPLLMMDGANMSSMANFDSQSGARDGNMHCYCQAVVLHGHYERDRNRFLDPRACEKDPSDGPCQMFLVLRKRLQRHFGLVPFGETAPLASFQRFGFWPNVTNVSTPRLLMGLRNVRFLAQANEIEAMARELGFATQRIYFEEHSYEAQFTAMRSADVFLSVHGAALTWLLFLDTLGPNAFCRSVIEMMLPIKEFLVPFYLHESTLSNVSIIRVIHARSRYLKGSKQRLALKKDKNPYAVLHVPQLISFNLDEVQNALTKALRLRITCKS